MACGDRLVVLAPQLIKTLTSNLADWAYEPSVMAANNTTAFNLVLLSTDVKQRRIADSTRSAVGSKILGGSNKRENKPGKHKL